MKLPDKEHIKTAQKETPWDFGNKIFKRGNVIFHRRKVPEE